MERVLERCLRYVGGTMSLRAASLSAKVSSGMYSSSSSEASDSVVRVSAHVFLLCMGSFAHVLDRVVWGVAQCWEQVRTIAGVPFVVNLGAGLFSVELLVENFFKLDHCGGVCV